MSNSHECMGVNGEALQLHAVYKTSFTRSHMRIVSVQQLDSIIALYYSDTYIIFCPLPCFYSNRWVLSSTYRQEVVNSISYTCTTGCCKIAF